MTILTAKKHPCWHNCDGLNNTSKLNLLLYFDANVEFWKLAHFIPIPARTLVLYEPFFFSRTVLSPTKSHKVCLARPSLTKSSYHPNSCQILHFRELSREIKSDFLGSTTTQSCGHDSVNNTHITENFNLNTLTFCKFLLMPRRKEGLSWNDRAVHIFFKISPNRYILQHLCCQILRAYSLELNSGSCGTRIRSESVKFAKFHVFQNGRPESHGDVV